MNPPSRMRGNDAKKTIWKVEKMPGYDDLREFMEMLEEKNQLVRVSSALASKRS